MKFFVAKVDTSKVRFEEGQAMLSPLRFHYDTDTFSLPVRLGLLNSSGTQDLIVHILAREQRYEVANYANVTVPTNLDVTDETRRHFGSFYAALFDRTLERHARAVVTEYSWDAGSCDPCPTPPLRGSDISTLGGDVLDQAAGPGGRSAKKGAPAKKKSKRRWGGGFVLTRLHARYAKDALGEDLVFRAAPPIVGGREFLADEGKLEVGSKPGGINNFQARYAIRHEWTGPITCDNPRRGMWGDPPDGRPPAPPAPAQNLAFVARDANLGTFVPAGVPELGIMAVAGPGLGEEPTPAPPQDPAPSSVILGPPPPSGCAACAVGSHPASAWHGQAALAALLGALGLAWSRRTRRPRSSGAA